MSCCDNQKEKADTPARGLSGRVTELVTGPRRWWLFGALGVTAGLLFGWEQLVLFGIAPLLISLLPCLVMCGLGLCMMKCNKKTANTADTTADTADTKVAVGQQTQVTKRF